MRIFKENGKWFVDGDNKTTIKVTKGELKGDSVCCWLSERFGDLTQGEPIEIRNFLFKIKDTL